MAPKATVSKLSKLYVLLEWLLNIDFHFRDGDVLTLIILLQF